MFNAILTALLVLVLSAGQTLASAMVDFTAVQTSFESEYPAVVTVGVAILATVITVILLVRLFRRLVGR